MQAAQLRYPSSGGWALYWPDRHCRWHNYAYRGATRLDLGQALEIVRSDPLGVFFG